MSDITEYKRTLDKARSDLAAAVKQRSELDQHILKLQRSIEGLAALCDEEDYSKGLLPSDLSEKADDKGITDTIRDILRESHMPLTVPDIRDALAREGFDEKEYSNLLTVIHNTLRRLAKQGEAGRVKFPTGGLWGWIGIRKMTPPPTMGVKKGVPE